MAGKAGELIPSYRSEIFPIAPAPSPSRRNPPTWVARAPSVRGLEAMKCCQDIIQKMKATSKAEREEKQFSKTLAGVSGTRFIWKFVEVGKSGKKKG